MKSSRLVIDPETLRSAAGQAVGALKLLANEDRLLLLCQLSQGEICVGDLEAQLGIHQPTLSQQLGVLREEGIVETRREGKFIYYRIASAPAMAVLQTLYASFCQPAKPPAMRRTASPKPEKPR